MTQKVEDHKEECEIRAEVIRETNVDEVREERFFYIEFELTNTRESIEAKLADKLASSTTGINAAVAAATEALEAEQLASKARVNEKREETEKAIKELVYNCNTGKAYCDQYALNLKIKDLVEAFDQFIENEAVAWQYFSADQNAEVNSVIADEIACLARDI